MGTVALILVVVFVLLLIMNVPIAVSIALASFFAVIAAGSDPTIVIAGKMANGVNSFALLAIPFFILSGHLMGRGGLARRLIDFAAKQDLPPLTTENALEYLLKALETGSDEEKHNALAHLSRTGKDDLIPALLEIANTGTYEIAHQAMLATWFCASKKYSIFS